MFHVKMNVLLKFSFFRGARLNQFSVWLSPSAPPMIGEGSLIFPVGSIFRSTDSKSLHFSTFAINCDLSLLSDEICRNEQVKEKIFAFSRYFNFSHFYQMRVNLFTDKEKKKKKLLRTSLYVTSKY